MKTANPDPENSGSPQTGLSLGVIEATNAILILLAALSCWLVWGQDRGVGVLIGGALSAGSFRVVVVVMKRILVPKRSGWWPVGVFWLKYMAMIAAVAWLMLKVKLDVIGFLVGVTLIVPSILMEAVRQGMAREEQGK